MFAAVYKRYISPVSDASCGAVFTHTSGMYARGMYARGRLWLARCRRTSPKLLRSVLGWLTVRPQAIKTVLVDGALEDPIARVDERYLSFSIDISVLAGGQWWEGSHKTHKGLGGLKVLPFNLYSAKLDHLTQGLGASYLRVGGSEADKIHYFTAPPGEVGSLVLTQSMWDGLHEYVDRNALKLAFTFKYGLFKRSTHGDWQANEVLTLLRYSQHKHYKIAVCELGNELNAYWAFHGLTSQPRAIKLADDYATFSQTVKAFLPEAKVIGPGSAFWPHLGETIRPFSNITAKFLAASSKLHTAIDIIDWHYYPFQSQRSPVRTRRATRTSMLHPKALNEYKKYAQQLKRLRDTYYPSAQLWTGESGSAQCGGEPKLSDRFASCFWWADQLGLGAANGQQVMIRQSLVGGDYGLLERLTLKPRPDYWLSWLWQQLMGQEVFSVTSPHAQLRVYCHSLAGSAAGRCLLLINVSAKPCHAVLSGGCQALVVDKQYTVTAKKITSKKLQINGIKARLQKGQLPSLDRFSTDTLSLVIPAHAIAFWVCQ